MENKKERQRKFNYRCRGCKFVVVKDGEYKGVYSSTTQILDDFPELKNKTNIYGVCNKKTRNHKNFKITKLKFSNYESTGSGRSKSK